MKFETVKNGYNPDEVDEYIKRMRLAYDETLVSQRDRIFSLKDELMRTENALKEFEASKAQIGKAIESALSKADDIAKLTRRKYAKELAALRSFHKQWVEHYAKILEQYPLDETLENTNRIDRAMTEIMDEAERTPPIAMQSDEFNPVGMIENHLASDSVEDDDQFDYDAAVHPTENLEQILKDLGVLLKD